MVNGYYINHNDAVIFKRVATSYEYHQHLVIEDENWESLYRLELNKNGLIRSYSSSFRTGELHFYNKLKVDEWEYKSLHCSDINFGGEQITAPGNYYDTIGNQVNALFVLDPPTEKYYSQEISETAYEYNGVVYTESTLVVDTFSNVYRCDSIIEKQIYIVSLSYFILLVKRQLK
jgi:hypothetical protein